MRNGKIKVEKMNLKVGNSKIKVGHSKFEVEIPTFKLELKKKSSQCGTDTLPYYI